MQNKRYIYGIFVLQYFPPVTRRQRISVAMRGIISPLPAPFKRPLKDQKVSGKDSRLSSSKHKMKLFFLIRQLENALLRQKNRILPAVLQGWCHSREGSRKIPETISSFQGFFIFILTQNRFHLSLFA